MARLGNWQNELSALIERRRNSPQQFGEFDCCMWAFEDILAIRGDDLGKPFRGNYDSVATAIKVLRRIAKADTPYDYFKALLGERQPTGLARPGDLVFANPESNLLSVEPGTRVFGLVPGVCYGAVSYFVGEFGLIELDTLSLECALWVS